MLHCGLLFALGSGLILLGGAQAQTAPPPAAAPTIRTTASEVMLDIVVRDKHGKAVRNLKQADVQILEDGVPRPLKSFRFAGAREAENRGSAAPKPEFPFGTGTKPLHTVNLICLV